MSKHRRQNSKQSRAGAVLVLVAIALIPLMACIALAIDLGMLLTARTQVVQAADAAAMAGARALNGNSTTSNNYAAAAPTAQAVAGLNTILGTTISSSQVTVNIGRYTYNTSTQQFEGQFPGPSTDNWSLVQATVSVPVASQLPFSKMFNFSAPNIQSTATAVHRPRDVSIILDFSGSMRFASCAGGPWSSSSTYPNNPDTNVPNFGHYNGNSSKMVATSFTTPYEAANLTTTTSDGRPPIVNDFYQDANGTAAWTAASSAYATTPGGDNFKMTNKNTGASYAQTAAQLLNIASPTTSTRDATFETSGYTAYGMSSTFSGYTQGPGYWGKTFFIWPPDPATNGGPSGTNDWRKRYFTYPGSATQMDDNSKMWDSSGNLLAPGSTTYNINYAAILDWIKNIGPSVFPTSLRSGRIVYYSSIPSSITTSTWPPSNLDERFWKDYIDYCLGVVQTSSSTYQVYCNGSSSDMGYGTDFTWGTVKITAKSSLSGGTKPYMFYGDNPQRPVTKFWFGPMSMVDFLSNYTLGYDVYDGRYFWWPGTCHESPMYACKLGIRAALTDIQTNHPNDWVSLIFFSTPQSSSSDTGARFNRVRVGLGRSYQNMLDSLWYPPATVGSTTTTTVSPYDSANVEVPRAWGGTCYSYPLMLAYNQFSGNTTLQTYNSTYPTGDAGGNGRKGAQKLIIFETDGAPNTSATATLQNSGAYNSYYKIRYNSASPGSSDFPTGIGGYSDLSSTVTTQISSVCSQICAADTASPPGYSTGNKLVKIHCIGFGPVFSPSSSTAAAATAYLNTMQTIGNVTDGMPSYKIIYGSQDTVISNLQKAFQTIMADGIQVTLIQ